MLDWRAKLSLQVVRWLADKFRTTDGLQKLFFCLFQERAKRINELLNGELQAWAMRTMTQKLA